MAELFSISLPLIAERQLDVVFVHGLGGDPFKTWRSGADENTSWPHWLAHEFGPQIGVWSVGYASAPSRLRGLKAAILGSEDPDAGAAMSLPRRSENVLDRLVSAGIGQRPVCFITHSLGGLLVKSILRSASDSVSAPERLQVVEQCRGVLFLATPHHGSRLADLTSAFKFYFPTVSTLDLKDNDDHLLDLYEWYRSYAPDHQILTRSYYESKETRGLVIVVPRSSADPGITGKTARRPTPLDRDHLEISKPRNRNDQAYIGSTQLIRLILDGAIQKTAPAQKPFLGAHHVESNKHITEAVVCEKPILDLVIGETRTLEQALDAVRFFNKQMNPSKKARLVYIEEGSTHLFIDGPEETLREIHDLYRRGELQKLLADSESLEMLTIITTELVYDKDVLGKAALINEAVNMRDNDKVLLLSDLRLANLREAYLSWASLFGADLSEADLTGANLIGAELVMANLRRSNLRGADLREANLSEANLNNANLTGANFFGAVLIEADITGANLRGADLSEANLRGADLSEANLRESYLSGANLSGANLSEADLTGANLIGAELIEADLIKANLRGADLREANFRESYLSGTNFFEADLTNADFTKARLASSKFGRNAGLSKSQIIDMQSQGALFVDSPESGVPSPLR